jgi:hypothetical protein
MAFMKAAISFRDIFVDCAKVGPIARKEAFVSPAVNTPKKAKGDNLKARLRLTPKLGGTGGVG